MSPQLVAVILTSFAVGVVLILMPKDDRPFTVAVCAAWVSAAAIAFFVTDKSLAFISLFVTLAVIGAMSPRGAVFLFLGAMAALPIGMTYQVPMIGLNYLITLDYAKLATLVLLGPAFIKATFTPAPANIRSVGNLLLFFVLFTGVMSFRDLPFTSVLRQIFDLFVLVYVPFFTVSRTLKTQEDVNWALRAMLASFLIMAMIGGISALRSWNYYAFVEDVTVGKAYFDRRNGFLRTGATVIPSLLALLASAGMLQVWMLKAKKQLSPLYAYAALGILAFACFVTGARGGWMAAIACVGAYVVLNYGSAALRKLSYAVAIVCVIIGFNLVFTDSDVLNDEYGTVSYRAELIRTSVVQIQQRPLFGSSDIFNLPSFQHLRQGEGIIDLVNAYLQIVLFYGLVGLGSLLGAHAIGALAGLKELKLLPERRAASPAQAEQRRTLSFLLAFHAGYLVLIATISFVAQVPHYGYLILAVLIAQVRVLKTQRLAQAAPAKKEDISLEDMPEAAPVETAPSPTPSSSGRKDPVPYGARFVRRQ